MTFWEKTAQEIVREFRAHPTDFLRQPTIARCLHPNEPELAAGMWKEMVSVDGCPTGFQGSRFADSPIGRPLSFAGYPAFSPVTVQHIYHLWLMTKTWGGNAPLQSLDFITELGGGYGSFCRLVRRLGFGGDYVVVDLPVMHELQISFLLCNEVENVRFTHSSIGYVRTEKDESSLLVATFSVSEMPLEERARLAPLYPHFTYLFFAHNTSFEGVDNVAYFTALADKLRATHDVSHLKCSHSQRGRWYLLAKRR